MQLPARPSTVRDAIAANPCIRASVTALLISNSIPLLGVLFFRWDIFTVMFLFWFENVIIGVFQILKMLVAAGPGTSQVGKLFTIPFFTVHYGLFTFVHGVFVFAIFGGLVGRGELAEGPFPSPHIVASFVAGRVLVPVIFIFGSHAVSFIVNFIGQEEYRRIPVHALFFQPYGRVVVLHLVVLGGGFAVLLLGQPWLALAGLVVLKTTIDVAAHVKERAKLGTHPINPDQSLENA